MKWKLVVPFFILSILILYIDLQGQNFLLSDLGKDILVAKHLANGLTDTVFIRPNSTWAELPLTPLYFWFIALLYAGVRSPFGMTICVIVVKITMLFVLFLLGRTIRNTRLGIVFLVLVGTSEYYLTLHLNPFLFATLFFLLGLYAYIRATEGHNTVNGSWLFPSIFCVFLTLGVHISTLVIFPSFLFLWIKDRARLTGRQRFMMVSFIILMLFVLVSMTYQGHIEIPVTIIDTLPGTISLMDIGARGKMLFFLLMRSSPLVALFLIPTVIHFIRVKNAHQRITFLALMGSLGLFFMIPFSETRPLRLEYVSLPLLGSLLGVSYWLDSSMAKVKVLFRAGVSIIISIIVLVSLHRTIRTHEKRAIYSYKDSREIARMITHDGAYLPQRKLKIVVPFYGFGKLPNISDYFSAGIWYAMEEMVGKQLVKVVEARDPRHSNNIACDNMFEYILVCVDDGRFSKRECVTDFKRLNPKIHLTRIGHHGSYTIYKSY